MNDTGSHRSPGSGFYHVGFAVPDIEKAMESLSGAAGVVWNRVQCGTLGKWNYQIVFTTEAPFIELISSSPGSPWDTSQTGARFDHLGWWVESIDKGVAAWSSVCGLSKAYDGRVEGRRFAYFDADAIGARLELVDIDRLPQFLESWSPVTDRTSMCVLRVDSDLIG